MKRVPQALKWHGGQYYSARWLVDMMPKHIHYVEPYFGGGAVLFAKSWVDVSEVVNDRNSLLVNFWRVLQSDDTFVPFMRRVQAVPFSEREFLDARERLTKGQRNISPWSARGPVQPAGGTEPKVDLAVDFFIVCRQSRQGLGKDFSTVTRTRTRRGMNGDVAAWLGCIDGLPEVAERLRRVLIYCREALHVIETEDMTATHFYCDPPYYGPERAGKTEYGDFEMTEEQHIKLLQTLGKISGTFQLTGYHSATYDWFAKEYKWRCEELKIDNKASSAKRKQVKTVCCWMNY